MNKTRLQLNEILSLAEWIKSWPIGMQLEQNETKDMLNKMRLQISNFPKNLSLTHAWHRLFLKKIYLLLSFYPKETLHTFFEATLGPRRPTK
jgi:hypothetical protein